MAYRIVPDLCVVCDACRLACPRNAISAHVSEKTYVAVAPTVIWQSECDGIRSIVPLLSRIG
ncbi:hypothetical protein GC175_26535 [bacterium]|nr:hypothetical protein [bacterium]